jgi:hypothetical protein
MTRADLNRLRRVLVGVLIAALALGLSACGSVGSGGGSAGASAASASAGTAALNWSPVTETTTDAALTNLAGYKIYYGTSPGNLNNVVVLASPGATSYLVTNLAPGIWYFGVTAFTNTDVESAMSDIVSQTVD